MESDDGSMGMAEDSDAAEDSEAAADDIKSMTSIGREKIFNQFSKKDSFSHIKSCSV